MAGFLKLIRYQNLIIIALTFYMVRHLIIFPFLKHSSLPVSLSHLDFFLIVLSTIFIAAAGYSINDYFDTRIDKINKPQKVVVGVTIKRRVVMAYHWVLNISAILIAFYLAIKSQLYLLSVLHFFTATLLIIYSFKLKREFLSGNLVIAFLSGLIPFLAAYYDVSISFKTSESGTVSWLIINNRYLLFLFVFILFAFLITFVREIIKDSEDYEGDLAFGCNTIPIKLGIRKASMLAAFIEIIVFTLLLVVQWNEFILNNLILFFYLAIFVQIPLLVLIFKTIKSHEKSEFTMISKLLKLIMLTGILSSLVVYYTS